jgi:hypothetical protein
LIEKEEEDNRKLSMKNEGEDERIDIRKKIINFIHPLMGHKSNGLQFIA